MCFTCINNKGKEPKMQNLYNTKYQDSMGISREVYTIATNKQEAIRLAFQRILELHKQEELWQHRAIAAGMTARTVQEPRILNTTFVYSANEEVGA